MDDQDNPESVKQPRYWGFLVAAVYVLVMGIGYIAFGALVSGIFQGIVLVPTLLFGGGFLAMWWYSGST